MRRQREKEGMTAATWQLQALGVMLLHCDQTVKDTEND